MTYLYLLYKEIISYMLTILFSADLPQYVFFKWCSSMSYDKIEQYLLTPEVHTIQFCFWKHSLDGFQNIRLQSPDAFYPGLLSYG